MFELKVATIERLTYEAHDVIALTLPTKSGEITILDRHIPLISLLVPGVIRVEHKDGREEHLAVQGGLVEVRTGEGKTETIVLADTAELSHEIDIERAKEAKERAEQALKEGSKLSREEYEDLLETLVQEEIRLKVAAKSGKLA